MAIAVTLWGKPQMEFRVPVDKVLTGEALARVLVLEKIGQVPLEAGKRAGRHEAGIHFLKAEPL